jgi:hypothetical protein
MGDEGIPSNLMVPTACAVTWLARDASWHVRSREAFASTTVAAWAGYHGPTAYCPALSALLVDWITGMNPGAAI